MNIEHCQVGQLIYIPWLHPIHGMVDCQAKIIKVNIVSVEIHYWVPGNSQLQFSRVAPSKLHLAPLPRKNPPYNKFGELDPFWINDSI